jgi:hypothetical protein
MATASSRGPALRGNGPGRTMTGSMGSFVIRRVGENEHTTTGVAAAAEAVVPDAPWRTAAAPGWNEVTVIRQRRLDTPGTRAVSVVRHLASLPVWERKARRVTVKPAGPRSGSYTASGRIAGLVTWHATFEYELTEAGFHSWMPTLRRGVQVADGFHVINDAPGSCTVVHYEQYHLPSASRSIAFAWRLYVTRSMNAELERIALLAQPAPGS